jgi:hypothetical protein
MLVELTTILNNKGAREKLKQYAKEKSTQAKSKMVKNITDAVGVEKISPDCMRRYPASSVR